MEDLIKKLDNAKKHYREVYERAIDIIDENEFQRVNNDTRKNIRKIVCLRNKVSEVAEKISASDILNFDNATQSDDTVVGELLKLNNAKEHYREVYENAIDITDEDEFQKVSAEARGNLHEISGWCDSINAITEEVSSLDIFDYDELQPRTVVVTEVQETEEDNTQEEIQAILNVIEEVEATETESTITETEPTTIEETQTIVNEESEIQADNTQESELTEPELEPIEIEKLLETADSEMKFTDITASLDLEFEPEELQAMAESEFESEDLTSAVGIDFEAESEEKLEDISSSINENSDATIELFDDFLKEF